MRISDPICLARSRIPSNPQCPRLPPASKSSGSIPRPLSETSRRNDAGEAVIDVTIAVAPEWRAAFINASRAI
jgi:hypothetical protein